MTKIKIKQNRNKFAKGSYYERYAKRRASDRAEFHFAHERTQNKRLHRLCNGRYGLLLGVRPCNVVASKVLHRYFPSSTAVYHVDVYRRAYLGRNQRSHYGQNLRQHQTYEMGQISSLVLVDGNSACRVVYIDVCQVAGTHL